MTTFEKIIQAIKSFGYPYSPGMYTGPEKRWFTYNYVDDYGDNYADDAPQSIINRVQVHFFLPAQDDYTGIKNQIRGALFEQGFTFPEIAVLDDSDPKLRHIVFECEIEEEAEG